MYQFGEVLYPFGEVLSKINQIVLLVSLICYFHHNLYLIIGLFSKAKKYKEAMKNHKYAFIVSARNEEAVIGNLIDSINRQNYPKELFDIFVVADNCTDNTAEVARRHGAIVYERFNQVQKGKCFALDYLFNKIHKEHKDKNIEAYLIFDADNLLDKNYLYEMNKAYDEGNKIITSLRNSKNFDTNWLTSGSAFLFFREATLIHKSRSLLNTSTYVSGTGFLVDAEIIKENGGWIHHTMIEDIEFSVDMISKDYFIAYQHDAIFYDEQPTTLKATWHQRLRWCRGTHQIFAKYEVQILKPLLSKLYKLIPLLPLLGLMVYLSYYFDWNIITSNSNLINIIKPGILTVIGSIASFLSIKLLKKDYAKWDLGTHIMPVPLLLFVWTMSFPIIYGMYALIAKVPLDWYINAAILPVVFSYVGLSLYCVLTALVIIILLNKQIKASMWKKIYYAFTFPVYMAFYLPITFVSLLKKIEWVKIDHTDLRTIENLEEN